MDKEKDKQIPNGDESENNYHDEMEELKNIFKNELKKAMDEAENPEDEIVKDEPIEDATTIGSAYDNYEVEGYKSPTASQGETTVYRENVEMCECCGEKPRGTRRNPDSPYCEDCEVLLEKYPYDWKGIIAIILVVALALSSVVLFAGKVPVFSKMKMGDKAVSHNKLYTANTEYTKALNYANEMKFVECNGLYRKLANTSYLLTDLSSVAHILNENISDKMLKTPLFKSQNEMKDEVEVMFASIEAIQSVLRKHEKINYDEVVKDLEALDGKKIYLSNNQYFVEGNENFKPNGTEEFFICDSGWIRLYMYSAAQASDQSDEVMLKHLEEAQTSGTEYLRRITTPLLAATYVGTGNYESAEKLCDSLLEYNVEAPDYYMIKSMLMRYRDSDYKTAIRFCDDGLNELSNLSNGKEMIENVGYMLSMQKALNLCMEAEQLNGEARLSKLREALDNAGDAHANSGTIQARDFYAIVSLALGKKDVFESLQKEIDEMVEENKNELGFEASQIAFSKDVTDFKDGKITLTEIIMSGRYDIQ